jgi:hypothetical protein
VLTELFTAGRESLSGGALPPCERRKCASLRSGVTVALAQPFGARLKRSQVCRYSSSRLPHTGRGFSWSLGFGRGRISDYGRAHREWTGGREIGAFLRLLTAWAVNGAVLATTSQRQRSKRVPNGMLKALGTA